jgi:hypothetical protein
MTSKKIKIKLRDIPVYEHLEKSLTTSYAQRLTWLTQANELFWQVQKNSKHHH